MAPPLTDAFSWWSSYYGDHQALSVTIRYLHLAALVVGGGTAIANDRQIARLERREPPGHGETVRMLSGAHVVVVGSIVLIVITGALMAGADPDTYLASPIFWAKMGLFGLLLLNGWMLRRAGRHAATLRHAPRRLIVTAVLSVVFWLAIVYVSSWLTVAA
jgi:hypothetical protein